MQDAVVVPVTVKHRLGIDSIEDYDFVRRFVETVAAAGCGTFFVHSRNAILKGLSPKDNRAVPPLKYDYVYRLKQEFPELGIVINGGVETVQAIEQHLRHVDGVMLGRAAYHDPYLLTTAEAALFGNPPPARARIVKAMFEYACEEIPRGTSLRAIARHMLGLYHGQPNARLWRRMLSDAPMLAANRPELLLQALQATEAAQSEIAAMA
jgi:tRNA-dihydrouridine synthase A